MVAIDVAEPKLSQQDRATIEFIANAKAFGQTALASKVAATYRAVADARAAAGQPEPRSFDEIAEVVTPLFEWQADRFLARQTQEMMWTRLFAVFEPQADALLAWLNAPDTQPLGTLTLDPDLPTPSYYEVDYHIQPGGMHRQPLIPFVLAIGQVAYHAGRNDRWALKRAVADAIPAGRYERMLDLACGIGQSIIPIKERFPESEVYGIDLSAPLLTYAHKLAEAEGRALHLSQQNAEHTSFPNDMFDVVTSCILFHEIPDAAAENVIREGYRIVKPGGIFQIGDTTPYRYLEPYRAFFSDWQTEHNGEPYWRQAAQRNLPEWLARAGFRDIEEAPTKAGLWITRGRK